jgi:hypothetical protein
MSGPTNGVEELLRRDVARVVGDVQVTETELRQAREGVDELIVERRRRDRGRLVAGIVAAAVVLPVLGVTASRALETDGSPSPAEQPDPADSLPAIADGFLDGEVPTSETLGGVWRVDNGTVVMQFSPSGDFALDNRGRLFDRPALTGAWSVDDGVVSVVVEGGTAGCAGDDFELQARVPRANTLNVAHLRPGSSGCVLLQESRWVLEQLLPTNNYADFVGGPQRMEPFEAEGADMSGVYFLEGGRYLLELDRGRTYSVVGESGRVDSGTWSVGDGRLELTSAGVDGRCEVRDRLAWEPLLKADPGTPMYRGTVATNDCKAPWAVDAWFRVPDVTHPVR